MNLEDSFKSALDYEAEVAYISMTSPVSLSSPSHVDSEDEFDFSNVPATVSLGAGETLSTVDNPTEQQEPPSLLESPEEELPLRKLHSKELTPGEPPQLSKLCIPRQSLTDTPSGQSTDASTSSQNIKSPASSDSSASSPLSMLSPTSSLSSPSRSPLTLEIADYPLDAVLPSTPTSKLRRIKEAQTPPSPKPHPKLEQDNHLYCTVVVYGSSGCGRTHLVDKLTLANPSIFAKVITTTTRKKRPHEVDGMDFHYLSHQEMAARLARGEFIEYIKVYRKGGKRRTRDSQLHRHIMMQKAALQNASPALTSKMAASTPPSTPPVARSDALEEESKFGSLFDLTEEDSPMLGGEVFGTSHQSLTEAIHQGKPCILINVSTRGAQQLKKSGLKASYVHVKSHPESVKETHTPTAKRGDSKGRSNADNESMEPDFVINSSSLDVAYSELHQYSLELVSGLKKTKTSGYSEARYQWDTMPTVQFEHSHTAPSKRVAAVSFSEILTHFQTANLKKQIERVKAEQSKPSIFSLTKLTKRLQAEKMMVQATMYCQLNEKEKLHLRMLQTVYSKLTGNALTCRRFGMHWQEIGFSGVDPVDDMQQVGLLGLTQLVFFLENLRTAKFCKDIFQYCHRGTHVIPFVVMAFEFSQLSMQALENGLLNKICNKRDQVFMVVNEFYMAAFHYYFKTWKSSQKSILQLGLLMQQCGDFCKAHPRQILQEFDQYLSIREPQNQLLPALLPKAETFTPFDEITASTS